MGDLLTEANILKINDRFSLSRAYRGIANVTDDVGITTIKETGILKSIISGSPIEIERKNCDPISWTPNSQFVMCCNSIPRIKDTSPGMTRRLFFIPFKMHLENVDIDMLNKLLGKSLKLPEEERNDNAIRYIMTKAILAFRAAVERDKLTLPAEHISILKTFTDENQDEITSFYQYLLERENDESGFCKWIDGKSFDELFKEFIDFLGLSSPKEDMKITQRAFLVQFNRLIPPYINRKKVTRNKKTISIYEVIKIP